MTVELDGVVIDGVDDQGPGAILPGAGYGSDKGVEEEIATETGALLRSVERQAGEQEHGDRVGLAPAHPRWCPGPLDAPHGERVVPDDTPAPTEHPRGGGAGRCGDGRDAVQPIVENVNAAGEARRVVPARPRCRVRTSSGPRT